MKASLLNYESEQSLGSVWGLCGLASVIERPIVSVYPSTVNGPNDELAALLNRQMRPRRNYDAVRDEVYIMWTSTSRPKSGTMWRSNHFVPLVKAQSQSTTASTLHRQSTTEHKAAIRSRYCNCHEFVTIFANL